jgi:predicted GNAT superfamily acetyltransferase
MLTVAMSDAWELAHEAAEAAGVELRPLTTALDGDAVNRVIDATWGGQRLDREVIRALAVSGNIPWAADAGGETIGFVLGWAGVDEDGLHVHSHMLAAVPDRRHRGVGFALKLAQRAQALDQGIHVIRWTYDPMVTRNAWFNLGKLGAVVDRFERRFYGDMDDAINAGERSDRFTVRWDIDRPPGPRRLLQGVTEIAVPALHEEVRGSDPAESERLREAFAQEADQALTAGLVGLAFDRGRNTYLFAREGEG